MKFIETKDPMYPKLLAHVGHDIECHTYNDEEDEVVTVCLACLDCEEVLVSAEEFMTTFGPKEFEVKYGDAEDDYVTLSEHDLWGWSEADVARLATLAVGQSVTIEAHGIVTRIR